MSDWIRIDPSLSSEAIAPEQEGVQINLIMSPFDVPRFMRGSFDAASRRFIIEFKYIGEEPIKRQESDKNITLRVGKHSGRLYGIEVNVEELGVNAVQLRVHIPKVIDNAIDKQIQRLEMSERPQRLNRRANFEVAKRALSEAKDEVFAGIATDY